MKINIATKEFPLTEALKEYIKEKTKKIAEHFDNITKVDVRLSQEKRSENYSEISFLYRGRVLHFKECSEEMYKSIDLLCNNVHHKLSQIKSKSTHQDKKNNKKLIME